ncbi:MAG: alkane 1-monooxygenase [Burkholderiales bacterium]
MDRLIFLLGIGMPLIPVSAFYSGHFHTVALLPLLLIPLLDLAIGARYSRPDAAETFRLEQQSFYRLIPMVYVPVQLAVQVWGAWMVCLPDVPADIRVGIMLSVGYASGALGITAAHDLGHRKSAFERTLSKILLVSVCYGHFYIEHNRGHHVRVGTYEDPATARRDESIYAFILRAVSGTYTHAWTLEFARLKQFGYAPFGWHNQMLWFTALPLLIAVLLGAGFGWQASAYYFGQSVVAFTLLELVDYIEHYGLTRKRDINGKLEPFGAAHAWDSSALLTNGILFNLQRHADHHMFASKRYQALASTNASPQLPTGYSGMVLLALVPPLWRAVMHPRLDAYQSGRTSGTVSQRS